MSLISRPLTLSPWMDCYRACRSPERHCSTHGLPCPRQAEVLDSSSPRVTGSLLVTAGHYLPATASGTLGDLGRHLLGSPSVPQPGRVGGSVGGLGVGTCPMRACEPPRDAYRRLSGDPRSHGGRLDRGSADDSTRPSHAACTPAGGHDIRRGLDDGYLACLQLTPSW
ncbi:hypothetical protein BO71DRAFT_127422 [Aspergillus ellipticus CBS 707.79]|uniref:Uncharacterized protein n=1 Tax=Aspergillus ellipticus CBS 707.79 TaxID=1448320 RepID=A0A319CU47_9EURO|nr:hypothetical protein BO71DRAFT_127422 [Aspergillus ellipticus CBS 707.79]